MKRPSAPKLVTVAITTTITIVFWVFFTLFQILTGEPDPVVDPKLLEPIVPELQIETLSVLKDRVFFQESRTLSPLPSESKEEVSSAENLPETPPEETPPAEETPLEASPEASLES